MVTRVRIEAEGGSTQEVEETLQTAFEVLDGASMAQHFRMFGVNDEALVEAQPGEFVVERFVRESGAIFYRGRQVAHYRESEGVKLKGQNEKPIRVHVDSGPWSSEQQARVAEVVERQVREAADGNAH